MDSLNGFPNPLDPGETVYGIFGTIMAFSIGTPWPFGGNGLFFAKKRKPYPANNIQSHGFLVRIIIGPGY
jgi:hypothetical protein